MRTDSEWKPVSSKSGLVGNAEDPCPGHCGFFSFDWQESKSMSPWKHNRGESSHLQTLTLSRYIQWRSKHECDFPAAHWKAFVRGGRERGTGSAPLPSSVGVIRGEASSAFKKARHWASSAMPGSGQSGGAQRHPRACGSRGRQPLSPVTCWLLALVDSEQEARRAGALCWVYFTWPAVPGTFLVLNTQSPLFRNPSSPSTGGVPYPTHPQWCIWNESTS